MTHIIRRVVRVGAVSFFIINLIFPVSLLGLSPAIAEAQSACTYSVSPTGTVTYGPGQWPQVQTGYITVSTQSGCWWTIDTQGTVLNNFQWLSIGYGRSGSGTVGYNIFPNTNSSPRTATITINASASNGAQIPVETITVTQNDGTLRATLSANRTTVSPGEPVTLTWTTNAAQTVSMDQNISIWNSLNGGIEVTPTTATTYTLTARNSAGDTVRSSVSISVSPCTYSITPPENLTLDSNGETKTFQISTSPLCEWYATDLWNTFGTAQPGPWPKNISRTLTGTPWGNGGMRGNGSVTYTIPSNPALPMRTAGVTVAGTNFTLSQTGQPIPAGELASECVALLDTPPGEFVTYEDVLTMIGRAAGQEATTATSFFKYGLSLADLDQLYLTLRNGGGKPYATAGSTGVYPDGWDERFTPLAQLACNGMVRTPIDGNLNSYLLNNTSGELWRAWSTEEARERGLRDITPDEYRRMNQIPYRFLAPSYVAGTAVGSCLGMTGSPRTVVFPQQELFAAIPFTTLERELGYSPSGAITPDLYDDGPCVRLPSTPNTPPPPPPTPLPLTPPPSNTVLPPPPTPTTALLYSQPTKTYYANFSRNNAPDSYAWEWKPTTSGVPTKITLSVRRIYGKPVGDICIRTLQAKTSAALGCATGIVLKAGDNVIPLNGGLGVAAGLTYYVHFTRTSSASDYPSFWYKTPGIFTTYRSSSPNGHPSIAWFKGDIAMKIEGVPTVMARIAPSASQDNTTFATWLQTHPTEYSDGFMTAFMSQDPASLAIGNFGSTLDTAVGDALRQKCRYNLDMSLKGMLDCAAAVTTGVVYGALVRKTVHDTSEQLYAFRTGKTIDGKVLTSNCEFNTLAQRFILNLTTFFSGAMPRASTIGTDAFFGEVVETAIDAGEVLENVWQDNESLCP